MKYLLTESVKHLKIPSVKVEKKLFAEGELYIRIRENLKDKPLIIISNITTDNFLEFLFTVDAAKRAKAKIKKIIIPFMSYARQDRIYNPGESVSGAVICSVLKNLKIPIKIIEIHNVDLIKDFGFESLGLTADDFLDEKEFIQLGYEPVRIDLITSVKGCTFEEIWKNKKQDQYDKVPVFVIGLEELIKDKEASSRPQDKLDLKALTDQKKDK